MKRSPPTSASAEYVDPIHIPERRARIRHQPQSLVYVELDEGNGGIALNIGEDGMAVQAVMGLTDDFLGRVRFRLPESKEWIQTSAQVVWANETRKLLGLRFIDMPESSRQLIREWFDREQSPGEEAPALESQEILPDSLDGRAAPTPIPVLVMPPPPFAERSTPEIPEPKTEIARELELEPTLYGESASADEEPTEPVPAGVLENRHAFAFQREGFGMAIAGDLPSRWSLAVFFLFLATASLAAGWAVGRGNLVRGMEKIRKGMSRQSVDTTSLSTDSSTAVPQPHLSEIEIVNANGVRWTIPLGTGATPSGSQAQTYDTGPTYSSHRQKTQAFRTWVLSAPVQPKAAESTAPPDAVAPPTLGGNAETPQNSVSLGNQPYAIPAPPPPKQSAVRPAQLIRRVDPVYPVLALPSRVQGTVKMHATVSPFGTVRDVRVTSGPPLLADAAVKAASQWLYSPMLMDGKPTQSEVDISMVFHLP
jgi:Gram-negative bacterial TonB protein C-terminal/PilZ domain